MYIFQVSLGELYSVHCTHCHQQGVESGGGVQVHHIMIRIISNFSKLISFVKMDILIV